jgi:hypothetical protein
MSPYDLFEREYLVDAYAQGESRCHCAPDREGTPMTKRPKAKTTLTTFSMLGSALTQPTPQLAAAAAVKPLQPPRAPAKAAHKSTLPPTPANAVVVPIPTVAPSPAPALPVSAEDDRIAARVAALVVAREKFPDVFDNCCPPLPGDMFRRLCGAGIAADASADVIRWWISIPDYRRAKAKRIDRRIGARMAGLAGLRELAPTVFDPDEPLPLAIGAHDQLTELGLSADEVRNLLRWWTRRREYYAALARGGSRYNLDASVAGSISDEDQEHARRRASDPHHASARKRPAGNERRSRT